MYQRLKLSEHPELARIVRAVDPSYRKKEATLQVSEDAYLSNTYWDGGSRSTYTAVDLASARSKGAPQYDPPQFGGPASAPRVAIPDGVAIVETGIFLGKTATAKVMVNPCNMAKLLTA